MAKEEEEFTFAERWERMSFEEKMAQVEEDFRDAQAARVERFLCAVPTRTVLKRNRLSPLLSNGAFFMGKGRVSWET